MIIFEKPHSVCAKQSIYRALQRVKGNDSRVVWPSFPVWSPPWLYASSVKNKNKVIAQSFWMIIYETHHSVCAKQSIYSALQRVKGNDSRVVGSQSKLQLKHLDTLPVLLLYRVTAVLYCIEYNMPVYILHTMYETQSLTVQILYYILPKNLTTIGVLLYLIATARKNNKIVSSLI